MKFDLNFLIFIGFLIIDPAYTQKVAIPLLARNKEKLLPYFLETLYNLNYSKKNITLWIWSDHNVDNTTNIIKEWANKVQEEYSEIGLFLNEKSTKYDEEIGPFDWPPERYKHLIDTKEKALRSALELKMDYIFFIDMDNFIVNKETLNFLINTNLPLVAPMLKSGLYSNFWGAMGEEGYYKRDDSYMPIVKRENKGCFQVPMIHSTYLINLKTVYKDGTNINNPDDDNQKGDNENSENEDDIDDESYRQHRKPYLTFDPANFKEYNLTIDDIIIFAKSAEISGIPMYVCNNDTFGYLLEPMSSEAELKDMNSHFSKLKLEILNDYGNGLNYSKHVSPIEKPPKSTMGFDKIYMINLAERPERRTRMLQCFDELGLDVKVVTGVDGKNLNASFLKTHNISMLPVYKDPYHKRNLTMGEIGCFLSHFFIWREVLAQDYKKVLIFEDDIRFEPDFKDRVSELVKEPARMNFNWDLIYLGRKRLVPPEREKYVKDSNILVWPDYSYWTLSYALSNTGARKLAYCSMARFKGENNCPLGQMVPVDEYLPIMFDMHPEPEWKKAFPKRDLVAFSAYPLIVYPTHYTGDDGYFSDTEDSVVLSSHGENKYGRQENMRIDGSLGGESIQRTYNTMYDVNNEKNMREEL